ncbi:phage adaptor protein [Chitinimonas sp. BJB300]|uniref:phage adaptor protein n=1 Tax=Chitinimonas sp. BJB300 TaxID=1559339 RepID=UPI000C118A4B|nr:DUF6682 family protein [Chitinimonas sp. BJB300]PHV09857.1 hypothetical protein CSQ89_19380 [Chitinimonas sp. BJB300]TSJ85957.1 hypothetical protein FG002_017225 [Chitinimonas sp. BJB300]
MLTALAVTQRFGYVVQDSEHIRWTEPELLRWISDAQVAIVVRRPSANPRTVAHALVAGSKQSLPAGAISLLDVIRNVEADGITPGRAIRMVDRRTLDEQMPDWHAMPAATRIVHAMYNMGDPKSFYVYPPALAGSRIELTYSDTPPDIERLSDALALDRLYLTAIVDYLLYRGYAKDAAYAANAGLAEAYFNAFESQVGTLNQVESTTTVNNKLSTP